MTIERGHLIIAAFLVISALTAFWMWGYHRGYHEARMRPSPALVPSPTTAAPYAVACDHGVNVYTTPQGGIAVFPGGPACHG